jgi:carboxymethylenebutenolidase
MSSTWIEIATADGRMRAYQSEPDGAGPYPGVVVCQEAFGVNAYVRSVCDRLADAGYVAIAPELFHRAGTHLEFPYDDRERAIAALGGVTNGTLEEDVGATLASLRAHREVDPARLAAVGFCMGGFAAILAGLTTSVAAVVAFYPGGLVHPRPPLKLQPLIDRIHELRAATLVQIGAEDVAIPPDDIDAIRLELSRSPSRHDLVVWPGAKHGFHTHDRTPAYHPSTAEAAWHRTLHWLKTMLTSAP